MYADPNSPATGAFPTTTYTAIMMNSIGGYAHLHKFEKGDKISFVAVNGLFYSCNYLSRNKVYTILEFNRRIHNEHYYVMISNDRGDIIKVDNDMFDNIQILREGKLKDLLGG